MIPIAQAAEDFLAQKRIAVAGVSRNKDEAANLIYRRLCETGHEVFAINPSAKRVEGQRCYPDLKSVPEKIDGVVMVTRPEATETLVGECVELNIPRVWMHRSLGNSVSENAVEVCRKNGITVIPGGCPMMFCQPVDFGHKCLRWVMTLTGGVPKKV